MTNPVEVLKAKAIYLDGTEATAPVTARAQVEVERKFHVAYTELFAKGRPTPYEQIYYLVWSALSLDGQLKDEDFDAWLLRLADADVLAPEEKEKQAARPTKRDRRPADSSN